MYLTENEMGILQRTERSMVRAMCGVQFKDRERSTDLMLMLGLKETIDHLTMTVCMTYGHVLLALDGGGSSHPPLLTLQLSLK